MTSPTSTVKQPDNELLSDEVQAQPIEPKLSERDLEFLAMNIVYQIGDALYDALPKDVAHDFFVDARQSTNDVAIEFAKKLIKQRDSTLKAEYEEKVRKAEKAYGGCHNCYGKGYATYDGEYNARGIRWPDHRMKFCDCERGKQLEAILNTPKNGEQ